MYVCMHVCMYDVYVYVCVYACMFVCMCVCMCVYVCMYVLPPPNRVTESKNKDYAVGDLIVATFGWQTHTISGGKSVQGVDVTGFQKIDPSIPLSPSTALGILGMTG